MTFYSNLSKRESSYFLKKVTVSFKCGLRDGMYVMLYPGFARRQANK